MNRKGENLAHFSMVLTHGASHFGLDRGRSLPPLVGPPMETRNPCRTIHHTESGGHSVDRAELLQSERVRKVISEVADKLKVPRTVKAQASTSKSTS